LRETPPLSDDLHTCYADLLLFPATVNSRRGVRLSYTSTRRQAIPS